MNRIPPEPHAEGIHNLAQATLHTGAKFDYVESSWTTRDGRRYARQFIRHPGSVVVLPLLEDAEDARASHRIILIRNFRHALGNDIWELPAGTRDRAEPIEACAARELVEETGYHAASLVKIGELFTGPGLTDERMHCFVATRLTHFGQRPEEDESMSVHCMTLHDAWRLIDEGQLIDSKSLATILLAQRRGLFPRA